MIYISVFLKKKNDDCSIDIHHKIDLVFYFDNRLCERVMNVPENLFYFIVEK